MCIPAYMCVYIYIYIYIYVGWRVIGFSGSLIWSGTLKELIFNPCSEFWGSPEGPVSQIHSPHLHVGAPGIFSDLLRFFQMLERERVRCRKQWEPTAPIQSLVKTAGLVPEFAVEDLPSAELQPWFLRLQWRNCPWAEHSDDDIYGGKGWLGFLDFLSGQKPLWWISEKSGGPSQLNPLPSPPH